MRPNPSHNPVIETVEESSNVGAFAVLAPTRQQWIEVRNQLISFRGCFACRALADRIHEASDRLILGVGIQPTRGSSPDLAGGKAKVLLPTPDLIAEEFESLLNVNNPRLLRMKFHAQPF
jgi:hypothetical protein